MEAFWFTHRRSSKLMLSKGYTPFENCAYLCRREPHELIEDI